jgi:RNA polymerase sigma-70 factor (ECF subfamily)
MSRVDSIIEEVLGGRTELYAEVIRLYQKEVWKVVASLLHDVATTEDLVQQTFVNAYTHLDQYEAGRDFARWIKAVARNAALQELRARERENRSLARYRDAVATRWKDEEAARRHEQSLHAALEDCRGRLSPEASRALDLRYGQALSFEEMAKVMERSVEAVRQLLVRIRLKLRECVERVTAHG